MDSGIVPREMVMRVEIGLSAVTIDQASFKGYMLGTGEATSTEVLVKALEGVEGLKEGASVVVRFDTRAKDATEREEQVERGSEALVPRLWGIRNEGLRVKLVVDGKTEVDLDDLRCERIV